MAGALIVGVAGCAGSESDSPTDTSSSDVVRIGLQAPLTGDQQAVGIGMLNGAELAAEEINTSGGINGKDIAIVPIDDAADPDTGIQAATVAIEDGLDAVVGPYNSGVGVETLPLYIDAGIFPMRLTSADTTEGFGATLQPMTSQIAPVATAAIAKWIQAESVALLFDQSTTYTNDAKTAMMSLLEDAGVTLTNAIGIDPGADDYSDAVGEALSANPDLVYVISYYREAGLVAQAMLDAGTSARCLADFGAYDTGFVTTAGVPAAQNCPVVGVPAPDDFADSATRVTAYVNKFGSDPGTWSPYAYDSVMLLADAARSVGSFDADEIEAFLNEQSDTSGWTGEIAFDAETGNRVPAPVAVVSTRSDGSLHVDARWAASTGFALDGIVEEGTPLTAQMSLSSDFSELQRVGEGESQIYGWNRLVGTTTSNLGDFDVVLLGNVNYTNGNGPFFGFLSLTSPDGDVLSLEIDGGARVESDGATTLTSNITVIGGSGEYVNARGQGEFTGTRAAEVGAPIEFTMNVLIAD